MISSSDQPDLMCSACGYDLRGLAGGGACPECGQAIAVSVQDRAVRPGQLRLIGWGAFLIALSMLIGGLGASSDAGGGESHFWWFPVAALIGGVGTWIFADSRGVRDQRMAVLLRVVAVANCTLQMAFWILVTMLRGTFGSTAVYFLMMELMLAVWMVASLATFTRAAKLAREVGDMPGLVQARLLSFLAPVVLLIAIAWFREVFANRFNRPFTIAFEVSAFVVVGWTIVFFAGFSLVLRRVGRRMEKLPGHQWGVVSKEPA